MADEDNEQKTVDPVQNDQDTSTELDFDNMSDEEFLKLSEEDALRAIDTQKPSEGDDDESDDGDDDSDGDEPDESDDDAATGDDNDDAPADPDKSGKNAETDPNAEKTPASEQSDADSKEEGKKTPAKLPKGVTTEQLTTALSFFETVTAKFKADGREFQVRSADDVVRLMQQGVNYSRRMQELKPVKHLHRMLTDHGLADERKLSFLIDVAKGDKGAITKLLKDHNIDTVDLDPEGENKYQARNYAGSERQNAFRDALDHAITIPEGQALVQEIHKTWDEASKQKLRENPSVLGNLVQLKQAGIYEQVVSEVEYQRAQGYLLDVPYLQAFDAVGEAMKNAGVFNQMMQPQPSPAPQGQSNGNPQQGQPLASGGRKAPAPKKAAPNPHLSSTPPTKQTRNVSTSEPDFDNLSDEEFLKMKPPS